VYKQSGIYIPSVQLMREDCGVWLRGQEQIKVDYYKAGFSFAQQKSCGNSTIAFKDTSRTAFGISRWEWDFGDGATASGATPQHSYSGTNTWPVQLIIYNVSGCSDTTIVSVFAKPNNPPSAAIISNPTGCVRQPVYYTAVVNSEDPVTLYAWTFNNGYSANGEQVINNYGSSGIFEAKLIVGTQYGCYDTTTLPITIYPTPIVNAGNDVAICRGQSAQLGAAGLPSLVWTPTEWLSCTTCPNPVASPADTRQYLVSGINSFGCVGSDSVIVNVIPPSKVEVALGDTICLGQSVQLSAWGNSRYLWSPANTLSASNIADPVATPKLSTTYRVIGTDDKNCFRDTAFVTITVGAWPKVTLGPDKVLSTGTQLQLVTTVLNGPIKKWAWTPVKDLTCPDCSLPVATVKKDVCYTVTVQNNFNCEASDTLCIKAFCESTQVFIPNAFVPGATSNNILMVRGKGIKLVKSFRIFNRWGQMVFDRANFQANEKDFGWDGKINGVPATPDVYVYTCEVLCEDDKAFTYKGNVAILK
jgi:PKD repeat protein